MKDLLTSHGAFDVLAGVEGSMSDPWGFPAPVSSAHPHVKVSPTAKGFLIPMNAVSAPPLRDVG